jgi:hypothetical protein
MTSEEFQEDLEELLTTDFTAPPAPKKRARKPKASETYYTDGITPETTDQIVVRIYKWNGGTGWHWEVKFPKLRISAFKDEPSYWRYDRYSGYAMTKLGAKYCVKRRLSKGRTHGESRKITYTVPTTSTR